MTGLIVRATALGVVMAVVTAIFNVTVGVKYVDPVSVWLLFSGSYVMGGMDPADWRQ